MSAKHELRVGELFAVSSETGAMFATIEPRPWTTEALRIELVAEYGSLAHCIMDKGGYKLTSRFSKGQTEDECSDVLFILMRLLAASGIELPPDAVVGFEQPSPDESPESLFLAAARAMPSVIELAGTPEAQPAILDACAAIALLAAGLGLRPLEIIHAEEMAEARDWIGTRTGAPASRGAHGIRALFRRLMSRRRG